MKAKIHVTLKNGVFDPQGAVITRTLHTLGFDDVEAARQGKYIELDLKQTTREQAQKTVEDMCNRLLANTVIENYRFELAD